MTFEYEALPLRPSFLFSAFCAHHNPLLRGRRYTKVLPPSPPFSVFPEESKRRRGKKREKRAQTQKSPCKRALFFDRPPTANLTMFESRRSCVLVGPGRGVACSSQPAASQAAADVLRRGGNAADAAVAAAAALAVVQPCSTGAGGDAFCLYFDAKEGKVNGLNGSGRAPGDPSCKQALEEQLSRGNERGGATVTVPGGVY
jgi:Gamma-glutamyltranspeptidase